MKDGPREKLRKEILSEMGRNNALKRWANSTKEQRQAHSKIMLNARTAKRK